MAKPTPPERKRRVYKAVGPRLKKILAVVFGLFALLVVNSVYLVSVTIAGTGYQNWFYLNMFMLHLVLGLLIIVPTIAFGIGHMRNTRHWKNKRAIKVGYALFATAVLIFISGIVLTRVDLFGFRFEVNNPTGRSLAYWAHVLCPVIAVWLFILHRLAGKKIKWKVAGTWAAVAAVFAAAMLLWQTQDPREWNTVGPESGEQYFFPSLARTSTGDFIPADVLKNDAYCMECHVSAHETWSQSAHAFSSFNNPVYNASVKATRAAMMERDGNVQGSRFCAGCHDPVPFFSGAFDDPRFDDPNYDLSSDPMAGASITCTVCHAISNVNSPRGNADYTITEPIHYPFAFSEQPFLQWVNRQLIKAKPAFHKATFLKPLHESTEFCGTCHKVHLPPELNDYKWLRGQNHYDSFLLSGVSGHGITSFYYPPKAQANCNDCHMPLLAVEDRDNFGADVDPQDGVLKTRDHFFASANTALPHLLPDQFPDPAAAIQRHVDFNEGVMRVDIFALKGEGAIDGELTAPLRPQIPSLKPGETYLIETVVRTMKMGHLFTQGTADSNQVWLELEVRDGDRVIGRSGMINGQGEVDPWSHFINSFVLDREGNRIARRNAEDIFVALYNNQIPPGAADVVHYRLEVPEDVTGPLDVRVKLHYRKFDSTLMRFVKDDPNYVNDLPIMTMAQDQIVFPVEGRDGDVPSEGVYDAVPEWMRWNDYGIGLFRKRGQGQLRQAQEAFERVEEMGRPDGPLNLTRVFLREGLIQTDAPRALARANEMGAPQWSLLWFGAQVAERNGDYDRAVSNYRDIIKGGFEQAAGRGFDFSRDYRLRNALGNALYQRALSRRDDARTAALGEARDEYLVALSEDPENLSAHWGLFQTFRALGDREKAVYHQEQHAIYKPDDNARDTAVAKARQKYPAANKAAEAVVIYDLHRDQTSPQ